MHSPWLSIGLAVALAACRRPGAGTAELTAAEASAEAPPVQVETVAAATRPMPEHLVLTGTLRASQESDVAADAAGKVTATYVERGQAVKRGDTLAILDSRGAALGASAAAAQSNLARSQLEQARKECDRVKALFNSGAISQAEYDRVTSQCEATQWSAAAAQAQQQTAQKILGDAVIRAPFAGVVGERFVSVGQYVQPSTRVASLYTPDPLRLELTVPEQSVGALRPDLPVVFQVTTYGEERFHGAVKFISPNVRPETRDLVVEALCPNPDGRLKPGMFVVAKLAIGERPFVAVPAEALRKTPSDTRVFVVADGRVQERVVQVASEDDRFVGVAVGLAEGERVVVKPGPDVKDGVSAR